MLRSINSTPDSRDDNLRHLLDQRTTRADLHSRFSTLSQFSDTPSVYSRALFSPRLTEQEPSSPSADALYNSPETFKFSSRSDHDRLDDPAASMLDLDEDPRSSVVSSNVYDDERRSMDGDDDEADVLPRMSLLGPTMRFHSRAPWEMDEDALREEDEMAHSTSPAPKKNLGFGSPRASSGGRPSGESARSLVKSKKSFETTSSQVSYPRGALYALAQESFSTSALGPSSTHAQKVSRGKSTSHLVRSNSPNLSLPSSPNLSASSLRSSTNSRVPNSLHELAFPPPESQGHSRHQPSRHHRRSSYSDDEIHPYANPDLVISYAQDNTRPFHQQGVSRSDSIATVTDSAEANSLLRLGPRSTLTPGTSAAHKNRTSTIQGKEISSPVSVINNTLRSEMSIQTNDGRKSPKPPLPGVSSLPGWVDRDIPPTFGLISLEEARAQRSRSVTMQATASRATISHAPSPTVAFPDAECDTKSMANSFDQHSKTRARSISAGAKGKNVTQIVRGVGVQSRLYDSESGFTNTSTYNGGMPGKTLKHKKSGFMRLFNGGRTQEREEKKLPPPMPSLSDGHAAYSTPTMPRTSPRRIPVPELAPAFHERLISQVEDSSHAPTTDHSKPSPGQKRSLPPLSINTLPQGYVHRGPVSAAGDSSFQTRTVPYIPEMPWQNDSIPQSAPAGVSEFPALKLRPVSTIFSAHFSDHIVVNETWPSLETDLGTPGSSNNVFSPVTPDSSTHSERRSSDKPSMTPISEDQSSVIQALQDQIVAAKKAWQRHIWELEGQVKDLKAELDELRTTENEKDYCDTCGRGKQRQGFSVSPQHSGDVQEAKSGSVVHRPRARTGTSSRFGSAIS